MRTVIVIHTEIWVRFQGAWRVIDFSELDEAISYQSWQPEIAWEHIFDYLDDLTDMWSVAMGD